MDDNKLIAIVVISLCVVGVCATLTATYTTQQNEQTKRVAMQLEIARLNARLTNHIAIKE